jgi:hypothetical protein
MYFYIFIIKLFYKINYNCSIHESDGDKWDECGVVCVGAMK